MIYLRRYAYYTIDEDAPNPVTVGPIKVRAGDLISAWAAHCQFPDPEETAVFSDSQGNTWNNRPYVKENDINAVAGWTIATKDDDSYVVTLTLSETHANMRFVVGAFTGLWDENSLEDDGSLYRYIESPPIVAETKEVAVAGDALVVCGLSAADGHDGYGIPEIFGQPATWQTPQISDEYGGIWWAGRVSAGTGKGSVDVANLASVDQLSYIAAFRPASGATFATYRVECEDDAFIELDTIGQTYLATIESSDFLVGGFEGGTDYLHRAFLKFDASEITLAPGENIIGGALWIRAFELYGEPFISVHESEFSDPVIEADWDKVGDEAGKLDAVTNDGWIAIPLYKEALLTGQIKLVLVGPEDGSGIVAYSSREPSSEDRPYLEIYTAVAPYAGDVYGVSKEVNVGPGEVTGDPITGLPPDAELRLWALDLNGNQDPVSVSFETLAAEEIGADARGAVESLSLVHGLAVGAIESMTAMEAAHHVALESGTCIGESSQNSIEALKSPAAEAVAGIEVGVSVSPSRQASLESGTKVQGAAQAAIESRGDSIAAQADAAIEAGISVAPARQTAIESGIQAAAERDGALEALTSTARTGTAAFEATGVPGVSRDEHAAYEALGVSTSERSAAIESQVTIDQEKGGALEALASVKAAASAALEVLASCRRTLQAAIESLAEKGDGSVSATSAVCVEAMQALDSVIQVATEAGASVSVEALAAAESLAIARRALSAAIESRGAPTVAIHAIELLLDAEHALVMLLDNPRP